VTVFVENYREGASRVTVRCYAQAWTAFWGSHGKCTVEEFIVSCNIGYVADALQWGLGGLLLKSRARLQDEYVARIVRAMQEEFSRVRESSK
jgi:hypothetical protein